MDIRLDPTVTELTTVLDGRRAGLRRRLGDHLVGVDVPDTAAMSTEEHRALVLAQSHEMAATDTPGWVSPPGSAVVATSAARSWRSRCSG